MDGVDESGDRYELLGKLGEGVAGVVYKARDREVDELVALKVLRAALCRDKRVVDDFKRELRLAHAVNHPNVARVYHFFRWRERFAIAAELIDGKSLKALLSPMPVPLDRQLRYLRCLCSALHTAHRQGVIHRDLKPTNILIARDGDPRIVDFGVAVHARDLENAVGQSGTPTYMSPEQVVGKGIDHRTDIYSLGVLLYRMGTGRLPFAGLEPRDIMDAHLNRKPRPPREHNPELPAAFEAVVLRCLEKQPADRYDDALDLYGALRTAVSATLAKPTPPAAGNGTVLVVDDDADVRRVVSFLLTRLGIEVHEAGNGEQALELAPGLKPDLILLDVIMPVMDGRETLRRLKADERLADIPVVMLTSLTGSDEEVEAKSRGAALFINKPVQRDVLELIVDRFLVASRTG